MHRPLSFVKHEAMLTKCNGAGALPIGAPGCLNGVESELIETQ